MSTNEAKEWDQTFKPVDKIPEPRVDDTRGKEWKPLLTRLNDAQLSDVNKYIGLDTFSIDIDGQIKTFTRKKIKARDYAELERIRAKYAIVTGEEKSSLYIEQFEKASQFYLGMTKEEFEVCDFETLKKIIDAQNIRTNYGNPNPKTS